MGSILFSNNYGLFLFRGFVALGKNQFSEAQLLFKDAVQIEPTNAVVSLYLVTSRHFRLKETKSRFHEALGLFAALWPVTMLQPITVHNTEV